MRLLFAIVVSALIPGATLASPKPLAWEDLVDAAAQAYEDPYRDLSSAQIRALRAIVRGKADLASRDVNDPERTEILAGLDAAKSSLANNGIDADWLISQRWMVAERRKNAATAANPAVDGKTVALAGFAIPAPAEADGTPVAYLVPQRGMCSHVPPPNANQMVRVRLTGDWRPTEIHEPVRFTGKLFVEPSEEVFRIVDGPVRMQASFRMEAEQVETIADTKPSADPAGSNGWAQHIAGRLRALGALPPAAPEPKE